MPDAFTTFITGLQTALAAALSSYAFTPGQPPAAFNAPPTAAVGFVWCDGTTTDPVNQLQERMQATIRLCPVQAEQFDGATPIDPTAALYPDANAAQVALAGVQVPSGHDPWYITVQLVTFDHQRQSADIVVQGTRWNDGTAGT